MLAINPFQPPGSDVDLAPESALVPEKPLSIAKGLPAGDGFEWLKAGFGLALSRPGTWILLTAVSWLIAFALWQVPGFGVLLCWLVAPVLTAGVVGGAKLQSRGHPISLGHLFSAIPQHGWRLFQLGGICAGPFLCFRLARWVTYLGLTFLGSPLGPEDVRSVVALLTLSNTFVVMTVIVVMIVLWFAPALVALRKISVSRAIKLSLWACVRNLGVVLVYALSLSFLSWLATRLGGVGWIALGPTLLASLYTAHRELFPEN